MKNLPVLLLAALAVMTDRPQAHATMPMLTEQPVPAHLESCLRWARAQDQEAVSMWGVRADGSTSPDIAILRLALSCLGDEPPDIVGFGSGSGFDDAYCETHAAEAICLK